MIGVAFAALCLVIAAVCLFRILRDIKHGWGEEV